MPVPRPVGQSAAQASRRRARRSVEYEAELARLQPYEDIARKVIRLRMDHHLSQEALAQLVGTTKSAISRLESGHHAPTVATLHKVATAFGGQVVVSFEFPPKAMAARAASAVASEGRSSQRARPPRSNARSGVR